MKLTIIIPVFNEQHTVVKTLAMIEEVNLKGIEKEIIVVDDGSSDDTAKNVSFYLKNRKEKSVFLQHKKNLGKGAAIKTGLSHATGDYILIQDADLEYSPKYIALLMEPILKNEAHVVYGTRLKRLPNIFKDEKTPLFLLHYFGNRFLSIITSLLYRQWITDMETGYKIFPKTAIENIKLRAKSFDFEPEITAKLLKQGYKIIEIPITTVPRGYNEGKKLHTVKDGIIALWTLVKYRFID